MHGSTAVINHLPAIGSTWQLFHESYIGASWNLFAAFLTDPHILIMESLLGCLILRLDVGQDLPHSKHDILFFAVTWCCSLSRMALLYSSNRKQEGKPWQQGQTRGFVLILAGVHFLHSSYHRAMIWTCAGSSVNNRGCSSYCWAVPSQSQGLFCFSTCPTSKKEVEKLGSDTARRADTSWPKGCYRPSGIMLSQKLLGRLGRGSLPGDLLGISLLVVRNCFCLHHLSFLGFILLFFFIIIILPLLTSFYLNRFSPSYLFLFPPSCWLGQGSAWAAVWWLILNHNSSFDAKHKAQRVWDNSRLPECIRKDLYLLAIAGHNIDSYVLNISLSDLCHAVDIKAWSWLFQFAVLCSEQWCFDREIFLLKHWPWA